MSKEFDPYRKWLGIPPEEQPPDHYRLLGIAPLESDPDVIENAADRQMAHVRRYQSGRYSEHSQRVLNELSTAKICLLDPARKADYDNHLRENLLLGSVAKAPPPAAPPMAAGPPMAAPPSAPPLPADESSFLGPSAVGGAATSGAAAPVPSFRGASRGRRRGGRRNRMFVPIAITVVSLLALVIAVAIAGIIIATSSDGDKPPTNGKSGDGGKSSDKSDKGKTDGGKTDGSKTDGSKTDGSKTDKDKSPLKSSGKTSRIHNSPGRKAGVRNNAALVPSRPASTAARS
jgi:hypothetical protein